MGFFFFLKKECSNVQFYFSESTEGRYKRVCIYSALLGKSTSLQVCSVLAYTASGVAVMGLSSDRERKRERERERSNLACRSKRAALYTRFRRIFRPMTVDAERIVCVCGTELGNVEGR